MVRHLDRSILWIALAVVVAPAGAAAHQELTPRFHAAPGLSAAQRAVAEALERWDLPAARAAIDVLPAARVPLDRVLEAQLAFQGGEYAEAVRLLAALPPELRTDGGVTAFARLAEATLALDGRLEERASEHFVVRFDGGRDWVLAEPALEALEAGYAALGEWLGERPRERVRVEIVPTAEDFERTSGLRPEEIETAGAVAICTHNKIMLLSPRLLLRGYPWRDTLNHEYAHYLLVRLSGNRAPIWLQEGIARAGEARWRDPAAEPLDDVDRSLLARALREGALIPLAAMDPSLVRLPSPGAVRLAFAECTLAAEHLLREWGAEGLGRLLAALAAGGSDPGADAALRTALGVPLAGFEEGWRRLLAQRRFAEVPGVAVPPHRLAGGGAEDWDLAEWQPLAAQNHLRLGDRLRARGSARAGLAEYERARQAAPASPFAHVKVARALLELGRADEAVAAAREAVRFGRAYPAAHEALAAALAALGDGPGAAAALRAALEINPFNPFVWRDLAHALRRLGDAEGAQRAAVAALRLGPGDERFQKSVMGGP
jgi:tetratricopeptide (TPR) repeat protein